jgi:hypothetical protein
MAWCLISEAQGQLYLSFPFIMKLQISSTAVLGIGAAMRFSIRRMKRWFLNITLTETKENIKYFTCFHLFSSILLLFILLRLLVCTKRKI